MCMCISVYLSGFGGRKAIIDCGYALTVIPSRQSLLRGEVGTDTDMFCFNVDIVEMRMSFRFPPGA